MFFVGMFFLWLHSIEQEIQLKYHFTPSISDIARDQNKNGIDDKVEAYVNKNFLTSPNMSKAVYELSSSYKSFLLAGLNEKNNSKLIDKAYRKLNEDISCIISLSQSHSGVSIHERIKGIIIDSYNKVGHFRKTRYAATYQDSDKVYFENCSFNLDIKDNLYPQGGRAKRELLFYKMFKENKDPKTFLQKKYLERSGELKLLYPAHKKEITRIFLENLSVESIEILRKSKFPIEILDIHRPPLENLRNLLVELIINKKNEGIKWFANLDIHKYFNGNSFITEKYPEKFGHYAILSKNFIVLELLKEMNLITNRDIWTHSRKDICVVIYKKQKKRLFGSVNLATYIKASNEKECHNKLVKKIGEVKCNKANHYEKFTGYWKGIGAKKVKKFITKSCGKSTSSDIDFYSLTASNNIYRDYVNFKGSKGICSYAIGDKVTGIGQVRLVRNSTLSMCNLLLESLKNNDLEAMRKIVPISVNFKKIMVCDGPKQNYRVRFEPFGREQVPLGQGNCQ